MSFGEESREPSERCPVCGARFRETRLCSRCGADLSPLMYLAAKSHRLRERARERLVAGNAREAWELARAAESAAPTLAGKRLERLARWLGSGATVDSGEVSTRSSAARGWHGRATDS